MTQVDVRDQRSVTAVTALRLDDMPLLKILKAEGRQGDSRVQRNNEVQQTAKPLLDVCERLVHLLQPINARFQMRQVERTDPCHVSHQCSIGVGEPV